MLHTQTVAPQTLGLLKQLEAEPRLAAFNLAGGTALALYLGHRVSVDLDLFTPESFDAGELEAFLSQRYGFQTAFRRPDTLKGMIDGVKIDCIAHKYAYLRQPYAESGIRLYSIEDIVAMKLSAIADDGSRLKDFVDIACLEKSNIRNGYLIYKRRKTGQELRIAWRQSMQDIVASVRRVSDLIGEITASSGEQRDGIAQVSQAVTQLDQMTQQNAALVEQSAAASESLREQARLLAQAVRQFKVRAGEGAADQAGVDIEALAAPSLRSLPSASA